MCHDYALYKFFTYFFTYVLPGGCLTIIKGDCWAVAQVCTLLSTLLDTVLFEDTC